MVRSMKRLLTLLAVLLSSCLPLVATPAYSPEGAASTGQFTLRVSGAIARNLSGVGYTTDLSAPSTGITVSMGVNEGMLPCVLSLAFDRELRVATYTSFVEGSRPGELSFSNALYCNGDAWTIADASGTLNVTQAEARIVGQFSLRLTSERDGSVVMVQGSFNLENPRG